MRLWGRSNQAKSADQPGVAVLGLGGAGSNMVSWLKQKGVRGGRLVAVNTDAAHLSITMADSKILIGHRLTYGRGAGGDPKVGARAACESLPELKREVAGSKVVFLCAGLGGGTGMGASTALAERLRREGTLIVGVVTLPFAREWSRLDASRLGLDMLRERCDTVVVLDNSRFSLPDGGPHQAAVVNELAGLVIKGLVEASPGGLDPLRMKGLASVGMGEGPKVGDAVLSALRSAVGRGPKGAMLLLRAGNPVSPEDVDAARNSVAGSLPEGAAVSVCAAADPTLDGRAQAILIKTGIEDAFFAEAYAEVRPRRRLPSTV